MRKLTFLLRPSWVILAVVVVAFAYLCFTVLAPWQLGKNTSTEERNDLIAESVRAAPVPVTDVLAAPTDSRAEWRRVTASGDFVPGSTVLVRLRHLDGAPGYAVLAAFRLDDGRMLLVDRGLVAGVDGSRAPQVDEPPTGPLRLEARVRNSEGVSPDRFPLTEDGYRQIYSIDVTQAGAVMDLALTPLPVSERGGYLQLSEGQPGAFRPTPLPQLDAGPYLSYGLQWLAFGIMAPLGLGYFVYAEIRERRRSKSVEAPATPTEPVSPTPSAGPSAESTPSGSSNPESVTPGSTASESPEGSKPAAPHVRQTAEARLADRYGRNR
ncbi:SURF1 family cytochrome oxidase biogenesis protein [Nocardia shimofusensis]|uniref:SURF1 family cytochrome oxidase biogenesis protein n=1 Tax=Nocardia shimofusensis TaxID=228596 RepID=UPI000834134E|nr:SURF1 family cytochrome oxidase biogenesis protein [Nocardia shimofusensis]